MGLRCLLGHDFEEIEIEREREEEGEEMVVTVREVKTCARCDLRRVVSENKEVTSIRPPAEATAETVSAGVAGDGPSAETGPAAGDAGGVGPVGPVDDDATGRETADDAVFVDEDDPAPAPEVGADADVGADAGVDGADPVSDADADGFNDDEFEPPASAEEDDGVILDDEAEAAPAERGHGEWPDSDDVGYDEPDEGNAWPEQEGDDEGYDAESPDGEPTDVEFGGGLSPQMQVAESELDDGAASGTEAGDEAEVEEGYDAEFIESPESPPERDGFVRADAAEVGGEESGVPTEYYCPSCEMTRSAAGSSMRAGDICPECKTGYVTERER